MHYSRISAFLLGALLTGSLFMAFVATGNFQTASEILKAPPAPAEKMIKLLGDENARMLLRYQAGEENRLVGQSEAVVLCQLREVKRRELRSGASGRKTSASSNDPLRDQRKCRPRFLGDGIEGSGDCRSPKLAQ